MENNELYEIYKDINSILSHQVPNNTVDGPYTAIAR